MAITVKVTDYRSNRKRKVVEALSTSLFTTSWLEAVIQSHWSETFRRFNYAIARYVWCHLRIFYLPDIAQRITLKRENVPSPGETYCRLHFSQARPGAALPLLAFWGSVSVKSSTESISPHWGLPQKLMGFPFSKHKRPAKHCLKPSWGKLSVLNELRIYQMHVIYITGYYVKTYKICIKILYCL